MPPRIRSPTYSEEEGSDELSDSPALQPPRSIQRISITSSNQQQQTTNNTRKISITHQSRDDDDLSSLGDSDAEGEEEDDDEGNQIQNQGEYSEDEEEEEEEEEEDDEMNGGVGDDAAFSDGSIEDDDGEYDELEELEPVRRASTSAATIGGGVKIKFKLGGGSTASTISKASPQRERWNGGGSSNSGSKKSKGKGKSKRRDDDVSDLSDDDGFSDASIGSSASGSGTRLTARQRAKEMGGEHGMELQSLPNMVVKGAPKEVIKLTDAEVALKRSEVSRKRKSQSDKKLEDEKTETINRLLKKQVGRQRSKLSSSTTIINPNNQSNGNEGDEDNPSNPTASIFIPLIPTTTRWISSIKSGEYIEVMGIPQGRRELGLISIIDSAATSNDAGRSYPGPRPPLKTRRFEKTAVVV